MIPVGRALRCLSVLGLVGLLLASPSAATGPVPLDRPTPVRRVVVVAVPSLGFDDVTPSAMPTLTRLAERGATAALSVKTIGRRTVRAGAYATIGAGARAVAPNTGATSGLSADERPPSGQALDDSTIVVPDLAAVVDANDTKHEGAVIGALGRALRTYGWTTAVVANHDGPTELDRVAALALARPRGRTAEGIVDSGSVDPALTTVGPRARRRTDGDTTAQAVRRALSIRASLMIEIGDVAWAEQGSANPAERTAAVTSTDRTLGQIDALLGPNDLLMVLAPTSPAHQEQPTPFFFMGPGVAPGTATSATTRRPGNVTLPDVSATILSRIGAPIPASMSGTPITVDASGTSGVQRLAALRAEIRETRFVDRSAGIFLVTLPIVFACWALLTLLAVVLPLGGARQQARGVVRWFGLVIAIVPLVTYLVGGFTVDSWGQPLWSAVVWGIAMAAAAGAWIVRPAARGVVVISAAIWGVLVIDVAFGGALQFATPLGNSPTVAGRFSGLGNNAFGLLAATTLVLAVAAWQRVTSRWPGPRALGAAGVVFAIALLVDGLPALGSDVGGVLALGPVAGLTLWSLSGRALSWRRLIAAGVGTLMVLGIFTLLDLSRAEASQTHLGRLARGVGRGEGSGEVFQRKLAASLDSFVDSSLVWIVICTLLLVGFLWVFDRELLTTAMKKPHAQTLVAGAVALSVLGTFLNDSGVMVAAMMFTVFVPGAAHVLLGSPKENL